jgi:hypothetical protein
MSINAKNYTLSKLSLAFMVWCTFWGGAKESMNIFKFQKKVILMCLRKKDTCCREWFKTLNVLHVQCFYIMEILYYIRSNKGIIK